MSSGEDRRTPETTFEEYDGSGGFGDAHGFDEGTGDWLRTETGEIRIVDGPEMVAAQLVRTLKTPVGDDPFRPDFGLDKQELLGNSEARTKQAIIDAIGPDADPRVEELAFGDITIDHPGGGRDADISVQLTLTDGTPLEFSATFRALLGVEEG